MSFASASGFTLRFATGEAALDALADDERVRLDGLAHPDRRRGFVLGRTAARTLLAERLGMEPRDAPLGVGPDGALEVDGHDLHLSIAHAGRGPDVQAVAALARRPVGVDLERITPRHPDLARRLLHPDENGLLDTLDPDPDAARVLLWTMKESVLKGLRTGLRRAPRTVHLTLEGDGHARAHVEHADDLSPAWVLRYERRGPFWLAIALADEG